MQTYVRLFGAPVVECAGSIVPLRPERRYQLLAWLALRGCPVNRDQLAALFWPDRDNATARRNLRKLAFDVQEFGWAAGLTGDRGTLAWQVATDVADFERALAEGRIDAALGLYRGPLCDGLDDPNSKELSRALRFERTRFAERWRAAVLVQLDSAQADPRATLALAQRLLAADPLDEDAVAAAMRAHAAMGRPADAARVYRDFKERLAALLAVEPSARLRELACRVEAGGEASPGAAERNGARPDPAQHAQDLTPRKDARPDPTQQTQDLTPGSGCVGRAAELQELQTLLESDECRLLTITGPGGIGKSRLAKTALGRLEPMFADGIWWVPLDDLEAASAVAPRIAQILGVDVSGGRGAPEKIAAFLAARRALLVLDNAEQVEGLATLIERLLGAAPRLKLIATSRRRLDVTGEWLLPLAGLRVPPEDGAAAGAFEAVQLFEVRARAAQPRFTLEREAAPIARIVRKLGGLPLAIELAAQWVRLLPPAEIEAELESSLDLLEREEEGDERPEHRSVRATFEQSWRRLVPQEQRALALLGLFTGTFSRAAAREVAEAPLPVLAALLDKSLVQAGPDGRFSLHPLIQQFSRIKLQAMPEDVVREARQRHLDFFVRETARLASTPAARSAAACFEHDLANIRAAWSHAIESGAVNVIAEMTLPLLACVERVGRWSEFETLIAAALATLHPTARGDRVALARLLQAKAAVLGRQGRFEPAIETARQALQHARALRDRAAMRANLATIGHGLLFLGQREKARRYMQQALEIARADHELADVASRTSDLAAIEKQLGHYDRALPLYQESLGLKRQLGEMRGVAVALHNIGNLYRAQRRWNDALAWLEEGLDVCETYGLTSVHPSMLANLGATYSQLGDLERAAPLLEQALATVRESGERHIEAFVRLNLTMVALARNDLEGAQAALRAALEVATAMGTRPYMLEGLMAYASLLEHQDQAEEAAAICFYIAQHEATEQADRTQSLRQLEALELDAAGKERARVAAEAMGDLSSVVAAVLARVRAPGRATSAAGPRAGRDSCLQCP